MGNLEYKNRMKAAGRCVDCGAPQHNGTIRCKKHLESNNNGSTKNKREKRTERPLSGNSSMRILTLDIETSPNIANVWGLWKQDVSLVQLLESTRMICWAAKFTDEDDIYYASEFFDGTDNMLQGLHELLDEADAVVTYNGAKFDIPNINREFLEAGLAPPSPYKQIDLIQTVKSRFKFQSFKLNYVVKKLGIGEKLTHSGHQLWIDCCILQDADAWEKMIKYNIHDVKITEELYFNILPWINSHPNHNLYSDGSKELCPQCGHDEIEEKGTVSLTSNKYKGYVCKNCGRNIRGRYTVIPKDARKNINVGVYER